MGFEQKIGTALAKSNVSVKNNSFTKQNHTFDYKSLDLLSKTIVFNKIISFLEFSWVLLGSRGLSWALLGSSGLFLGSSWARLGSPGLFWALLASMTARGNFLYNSLSND